MIEYEIPNSSLNIDANLLKDLKDFDVTKVIEMIIHHRSISIFDTKRWSIAHVSRSIKHIENLRKNLKDGESVEDTLNAVERIINNLKRDLDNESPIYL